LSEQERADLVAFLDGELTGEAKRSVERTLSLNPAARAEAESLQRTWELLDYLPRPEPSPSFTHQTLWKLAPVLERPSRPPQAKVNGKWAVLAAGWAAAVLVAGVIGYQVSRRASTPGPGEQELVRDLRLIENKRFYDPIDDLDFLRELDHPDLFGEAGSGR
jgi:anti-sigma factor RsiW